MIASQIVKNAEHKADVKNQDFIPYEQKLEILNNAYKQIYQAAINEGEYYFIKKVELSDGDYLPNDFYTISEVKEVGGYFTNSIIPRMSFTKKYGYEIVNDRFVLKGYDTAVVYYNPKPTYLTFPGKEVTTKIPSNINIVDYYGNLFLASENIENGINVSVLTEENEIVSNFGIELSSTVEKLYIRDNFIFVFWVQAEEQGGQPIGIPHINAYNFEGNKLFEEDRIGNLIPAIDTCVMMAEDEDETVWIKTIDTEDKLLQIPNEFPGYDGDYVYSEYSNTLYANLYNVGTAKNFIGIVNEDGYQEMEEVPGAGLGLFHYDDAEWIYTNIGGMPLAITDQGITKLKKVGFGKFVYGTDDYLTIKNGVYTHISPMPDTDMSYPNNTYYDYLSALVALEFIKRLEGNVDSINIEVAEERFYDTIHRDNFQSRSIMINNY